MSRGKGLKKWIGIRESEETHPLKFALVVGFFGGVIWGLVRWLETLLNFTRVPQAFLLDPFVERKLLQGLSWQLAGLAAFIGMSMIVAILYILILGRFKGLWPGLLMGAAIWGIGYVWIGPYIGAIPPLNEIGWSSIVTDFCLFLLWGLFIGYSISFEFHSETKSEEQNIVKESPQTPS